MIQLTLQFSTTSPLFLGDAEQQAALRVPSIKGALRFWYRAVDPAYATPDRPDLRPVHLENDPLREDLLFGGTSSRAGQAKMLLRLVPLPSPQIFRWDSTRIRRFATGRGQAAINGLAYLGYPFGLRGNEARTAIAPRTAFTVQCVLPRVPQRPEHRRGILASWWLLGTFGALGTRSRRGFGSLALRSWNVASIAGSTVSTDAWQEDMARLPALGSVANPTLWRRQCQEGIVTCREWLGHFPDGARHPHLGSDFQWKLLAGREASHSTWEEALHYAGGLMQKFRRENAAEGGALRAYLQQGQSLRHTPDRATFGLPLAFRFPSLRTPQNTLTIVPSGAEKDMLDFERHASLLLLKLVPLGQRILPLFIRMAGAIPGMDPTGAVRSGRSVTRGIPLSLPQHNAMDAFFASLRSQ